MENLSYIGLSQQIALKRQMEITANNMANMTTPGFKSQNILFQEYLNKPKNQESDNNKISQVQDYATYRDLSQGAFSQTSNPLDFAIQGEGYFAVQTPTGVKYTRAGSFSLNNRGELVTKAGYTVLNDTGNALTVQPGATKISALADGTLSSEKGTIGKLKLVAFGNPQNVLPAGDNLYEAAGAQEKPVADPQIEQGMLEGSNVQPVLEMNKMIDILRLYQSTQNMLMTDHERMRTVIQRLTKV